MRIEHPHHGITDQREEVAIARHDGDRRVAAGSERGDDVFRLEALGTDDAETERPQDLAADGLLRRDRVVVLLALRHDAMGLVGGRAATRNAGRQSSSTAMASPLGWWSVISRANMLRKPYTPRNASESGRE